MNSVRGGFWVALWILSLVTGSSADVKRDGLRVGALPVGRVLFLGNSITLHAPAPDIGWTGNWGMAASAEEKDYVHLLTADLARAAGGTPQIRVRNIADFERGYEDYDLAARLKADLAFRPDLIIVAIGENIPNPSTPEARTRLGGALGRLLSALRQNGSPAVFVRSSFWPHAVKDELLRQAAENAGATFVDIGTVGREPANAAKAERQIAHAGVAGHPGDRGMRAIADSLLAAIRRRGERR